MGRRTPADSEHLSGNVSKIRRPLTERLGVMVDLTVARWNLLMSWLRNIDVLRAAA